MTHGSKKPLLTLFEHKKSASVRPSLRAHCEEFIELLDPSIKKCLQKLSPQVLLLFFIQNLHLSAAQEVPRLIITEGHQAHLDLCQDAFSQCHQYLLSLEQDHLFKLAIKLFSQSSTVSEVFWGCLPSIMAPKIEELLLARPREMPHNDTSGCRQDFAIFDRRHKQAIYQASINLYGFDAHECQVLEDLRSNLLTTCLNANWPVNQQNGHERIYIEGWSDRGNYVQNLVGIFLFSFILYTFKVCFKNSFRRPRP